MVENSHNLTSSAANTAAAIAPEQQLLCWRACALSFFVFAVSPPTMNSAVGLNRSVNRAEGDPVVENRKVINLPWRAGRLERSSQQQQLSRLPAFFFLQPLGRFKHGVHVYVQNCQDVWTNT